MMETNSISLREALSDINSPTIKGKHNFFSIGFIQKDGTYTYVPKALKCGMRFKIKGSDMRGVLPVDSKGKAIGHPYPVSIFAIVDFNSKKLYL